MNKLEECARAGKLFDKTGREIMVGDLLKVYHFTGARRKRHYMYKHVVYSKTLPKGTSVLEISHLEPRSKDETYYEIQDGRILAAYEIVQGFGSDGTSFEDRAMLQSVLDEAQE